MTSGSRLRALVEARRGVLLPGAANALAARIIEDLGFEAAYITGAGVTNTWFGMPDLGFIGLSEVAAHTAAIRDAVESRSLSMRTPASATRSTYGTRYARWSAPAHAIQLEDQAMPKRCGHFSGKAIIEAPEMINKIKAAVDARHDDNFLIMARTDSRAVLGFDAAVDRSNAYREAGADIIFLEARKASTS
jgi:2-methylisocitrate lyase-like PEP mutase family enzyme